jgi:hypothetical protein
MKLYTEEQVRKAIELAQQCDHDCGGVYFDYTENEVIEELTPIELPSDEEIQNKGECVFNNAGHNIYNHYNTIPSWVEGAQWLRDKIQGGKK